ncbi:MAG: sugar ABC transporter substrate-binding protein [Treponema sp.]|nr:sugar ABC transporter substrate-binding protein [Treponema sp.]
MMKKRNLIDIMKGLAVLAAIFLLLGCSRKETAAASGGAGGTSGGKVTITIIAWGEPGRQAAQKRMDDKFMERNPDIEVVFDWPANMDEVLSAGHAAGNPPDVFFAQEMNPPRQVAAGMMEPPDDYMAKDPDFRKDELFPSLFEPFIIDGKTYVIPSVTYATVLYYNKDLFDKAGMAYPDESWTWDTYRDAAVKLTVDENNDGRIDQYGCGVDKLINFYLPWIFTNGGEYMAPDRKTFLMNSPQSAQALQFLRDLIYTYKACPAPTINVEAVTSAFIFQSGKVAMEVMGSWMTPTYDTLDFDYGITYMPKSPHTGKRVPMAYPNGFAMAARGKNKDAAWRYISYVASKEGQEILGSAGLGMPTNIEVANSDIFLKSSPKADMRVVVESMKIAKGPITSPKMGQMDADIIAPLGDEIFLNRRDTQEVLNEMKVKSEALTFAP